MGSSMGQIELLNHLLKIIIIIIIIIIISYLLFWMIQPCANNLVRKGDLLHWITNVK